MPGERRCGAGALGILAMGHDAHPAVRSSISPSASVTAAGVGVAVGSPPHAAARNKTGTN